MTLCIFICWMNFSTKGMTNMSQNEPESHSRATGKPIPHSQITSNNFQRNTMDILDNHLSHEERYVMDIVSAQDTWQHNDGRRILWVVSHEVNWARSWRMSLTIASMVAVFGCKEKSFSWRIASFRWERETTERCVKNSSDVVCNHKGWWWTNKDEWLMSVNVRRWYKPQNEK